MSGCGRNRWEDGTGAGRGGGRKTTWMKGKREPVGDMENQRLGMGGALTGKCYVFSRHLVAFYSIMK